MLSLSFSAFDPICDIGGVRRRTDHGGGNVSLKGGGGGTRAFILGSANGDGLNEDGGVDRKNPPSRSRAGSLSGNGDIGCRPARLLGLGTVYL
jgi:hypothetical protein